MSVDSFGIVDIIPHNDAVTQANLSTNRWQNQTAPNSNETITPCAQENTPLLNEARRLFDSGFNVFPQPLAKKAGYPWQRLQYTRLHRDHPRYGLPALLQTPCNIAIMCGKTSGNLFVLDCETREAFQHHVLQMRNRNIPLWAVESARGGHIYLRCSQGEVANIESGTLPNIEIRGCRCYVLAPPSLHPSGIAYHWIAQEGDSPPMVTLSQIDWLTDTNNSSVTLKLDQQPAKTERKIVSYKIRSDSPLSRQTHNYLTHGHSLTEGSRNNRLFSAACDFAGNKHSPDDAHSQLVPIAIASGLTQHEISRTIASAFAKSRTPAKPIQPEPTKHQGWKYALQFAVTEKWDYKTAKSEKNTFLALIERAKTGMNENGIFRASIRELAILARTSTTTVQKALKGLQARTLIFKAGSDKTSEANLWRFSDIVINKGHESKNNTLKPPPHWLRDSVTFFNSDANERGALGEVGLQLYRYLCSVQSPMMPKPIAENSSLKLHQVSYYLPKLREFGLVQRVKDGWQAICVDDTYLKEEVPRRAGTSGRGEARKQKYANERAIHAGLLIAIAIAVEERRILRRNAELQSSVSSSLIRTSVLESVDHEQINGLRTAVNFWQCPNCGQTLFSDAPPDMCDVCHDFTTWRRADDSPIEAEIPLGDDDPLLTLALELGAVIVNPPDE